MTGRRPDAASEGRLEELRREAGASGKVDAAGIRPAGAPFPQATPEHGYYGLPLLKPPVWTWEVPLYLFVGGAAGAAASIGAMGQLAGANRSTIREARRIAAAGALLSLPLLISDLGRPERFLNMLRVFKPKSAMSVGAWTMVVFSTAGSVAVLADLARESRRDGRSLAAPSPRGGIAALGDFSGIVAGLTGAIMATYTGVLLGATTVPVWSRNARHLPMHFCASAVGSAVSLLELRGQRSRALTSLAMAAALAESSIAMQIEGNEDPSARPLKEGGSGLAVRAAAALSGPIPFALRLFGSRSPRIRRLAALSTLAGSVLTRFGWIAAGRASIRSPE